MSDAADDSQRPALILLTLIVATVVGGVTAYGAWHARPSTAQGVNAPLMSTEAPADGATALPETLYFDPMTAALAADAGDTLERVAEIARSDGGSVVSLTPFFDPSAGRAAGARLAAQRAEAVRHGLVANGVQPSQVAVGTAEPAPLGDLRAAHRVELLVR